MSNALIWAWALGALLGTFFFGGLWWTVREGGASEKPALWFAGSLIIRMSVVVSGVYFISRRHPEGLLSSLLGLVMAGLLVMRLTRPSKKNKGAQQEVSHAPHAR